MSRQRRRAKSFTDPLNSFHTSTSPDIPVRLEPDLNKHIDISQNDSLRDETISNGEFQYSCMKVNDTNCEYEQNPARIKKFERILCSLDKQLNQIKDDLETESTLERLSEKFVNSPKTFTEKLVTIIEESVLNCGEDTCSRLKLEFGQLCKCIEDESWPEWAPSLLSTPSNSEDNLLSPVCQKFVDRGSSKEKLSGFMNTSMHSTPLSSTDVLKRRFFQNISKNHSDGSVNSVTNTSSLESFEYLEAQCKKLFPDEKESSNHLHRSFSMPSLLNMTQPKDICDQQMASLNISDNFNEQKIVSSTPNLYNKCMEQPLINKFHLKYAKIQKESDYKSTDVSYSKKKAIKFYGRSDFNNINVDEVPNVYTKFDTDELEKTILKDIAEKRKRCFDTVRRITEINANIAIIEDKKSLDILQESSAFNDSNSAARNETKFLKTLMCCENYLTYLERQKSFSHLCEKSESYAPNSPLQNKDGIDVKNVEGRDSLKQILKLKLPAVRNNPLNSYGIHRNSSPWAKTESNGCTEKKEHLKPKLFVTPDKNTPTTKYKRKTEYFPNM